MNGIKQEEDGLVLCLHQKGRTAIVQWRFVQAIFPNDENGFNSKIYFSSGEVGWASFDESPEDIAKALNSMAQ
jgi:hypothetical protein